MKISIRSALVSLFCLLAVASSRAQQVSFEVASIRPNLSGNTSSSIGDPKNGRFSATNVTLFSLIRNAYRILAFQIVGGPGWLATDRYDIQAKLNGTDNVAWEQFEPLLQNLLADRFRLRVHWETREQRVYALVTEKSGPKLNRNSGAPGPVMNGGTGSGREVLAATKVSIPLLAFFLSSRMDRIVLDKTGLSDDYDFKLEWAPDQTPDSSSPALSTALKEQLGLRLESQRGPVKVLVVDGASKVTEN
jgi:uncharacterized protein (TIGR03435 family)